MPWMYTALNGTLPVKWVVIIIMRATQKKMISYPVTKTLDGRKALSSSVSDYQPSVENGTSAEENHVSNTSSSRVKPVS